MLGHCEKRQSCLSVRPMKSTPALPRSAIQAYGRQLADIDVMKRSMPCVVSAW